jgi:Protein of unknown function, DUF485
MPDTTRRVTITSPRTAAPRRNRVEVAREIDAQTGVGDAFMNSLIRSQLRLALLLLGTLGLFVAGLPLLFALAPGIRETEIAGVPLPWVVLGVLVYPVLWALGWFYVHQAERIEHDFSDLVERQ